MEPPKLRHSVKPPKEWHCMAMFLLIQPPKLRHCMKMFSDFKVSAESGAYFEICIPEFPTYFDDA
jgi:hypothetical protein